MVRMKKTPLPDGVSITCENDYRTNPVFEILVNDCFHKCYICEDKSLTSINVEHRVAHRGNPELKFCWENLMYSCSHCNKVKNMCYNNIIDCTTTDPEEYIEISMLPYPKENVTIHSMQECAEATETVQLLERVYNGSSTLLLSLESENLRSKILDELILFQDKLLGYYNKSNGEVRKNDYKNVIIDMIHRSAAFSAIKRSIIRKNCTYMQDFGAYLE